MAFVLVSVEYVLGGIAAPDKAGKQGAQAVSIHTRYPCWEGGEWELKSSSPQPVSQEPCPGEACCAWPAAGQEAVDRTVVSGHPFTSSRRAGVAAALTISEQSDPVLKVDFIFQTASAKC